MMKKRSKKHTSKKSSKKTSKKSSKRKTQKGGSDHNEKVVREYIESLDKHLKEKKLYSFCVFPEQGFKHKMRQQIDDIKKIIKKEAGKHKHLVCITINTLDDQRDSILGKAGGWLYASIKVIPISDEGELLSRKGWNTNMHWKIDDFMITKFSLKLLETLMRHVVKKKLEIAGTFGVPFNELLEELGYRDIKISSIFVPLPNLV